MRITRKPTGIGDLLIKDSLVIVNEFHRENFGLDFISDNCEFREHVPTKLNIPSINYLTIVDSRPEIFAEVLNKSSQLFQRPKFLLWCVFPKNHTHLVDWIINQKSIKNLSIRDYIISDQTISLSIGLAEENDLDATAFFLGIKIGLELNGQALSIAPDRRQEKQLREQLVSIVKSLELVNLEPASTSENNLLETEVLEVSAQDKAYIAELEGRVVTLQRKLDALQRKYDALANSKLGKIVLTRWDKNRGNEND